MKSARPVQAKALRRVVVTGLGIVTPLGNDLASTWVALKKGRCGITRTNIFEAEGRDAYAAEVKNFDPLPYFRQPKALKLTDRKTRFAVAAASMALADAALEAGGVDFERLGVIVGVGGADLQVEDLAQAIGPDPEMRSVNDVSFFAHQILEGLNPLWLLIGLPNMVSAHVSIQVNARGPNSTVMTDWVAGAQAIGEAFRWIQFGETDVMLAGGADSGVSPLDFASYAQGGMFQSEPESHGAGFVPGEGAGILVLEEREHAVRRKARIHGEIVSFATASLPLDDPEGGALSLTMPRVLEEAGWRVDSLHAVCCASVFSRRHWQAERTALARTFCGSLEVLPLVEFKSRIGHTLSASGAIDVALLLKSLSERTTGAVAICNSLGYLGQAATLAVGTHGMFESGFAQEG